MRIDEKLFKRLKPWFDYMQEYDELRARPDKRVVLSVTIPLRLKKRLGKKENVSRFVERALENALA